ncbi:MAG: diguanylate cyclase [Synechococcus sp.]
MSDRHAGNLLIVDDNSANLRLLGTLLDREGYSVRPVATATQALQLLETVHPDLVLLDIHMPELDGYEVCKRIKQTPATANIPVIFISSADAIEDKIKGFEAGGIDYITKPFEEREVLMRVRNHLQLHFLQQELQAKITDLERAYATIHELSIRDDLTKLYNRRHFNEQAQQLLSISQRYGQSISFAICDVDRFKQVNDTFSHAIGDKVLQKIAQLIQKNLRSADLLARYGGEEFVIAFPQTELSAASEACNKIRLAIEEHDWQEIAPQLAITISCGVAHLPNQTNQEPILACADRKLYQAKQNGRNRICS